MTERSSEHSNGLVLAGGRGTRLWPMTVSVSKQLLPVAGRPMIYFPISTLMLAGIRDITLVCSPDSIEPLQKLFGDGSQLGICIRFIIQQEPQGIAHGFGLASDQNLNSSTLAVLGDNFFFGPKLGVSLQQISNSAGVSRIFAKKSPNPSLYGVLDFDSGGKLQGLVEKPIIPPSALIATGLYHFKAGDLEKASLVRESERGELEITELLNLILADEGLKVVELPISTYWSDLGTANDIQTTSHFVNSIEASQGMSVLVPEIIAWKSGWISSAELEVILKRHPKTNYTELIELEMKG